MKGLTATAKTSEEIKSSLDDGAEGSKSTKGSSSDWWAPVWKGLFFDKDGRHYWKIKSALWLLIYFFLCADRRTGSLKRKLLTISREMGVKTRTIRTWLNVLRRGGYIKTKSSGRCLTIVINKWKTLSDGHSEGMQSGGFTKGRVTKKCQSETSFESQEILNISQNPTMNLDDNDIAIKKDILKNDNVSIDSLLNLLSVESIDPQNDQNLIAYGICNTFNDEKNLPLYLSYVRKYPLEIIRRAFEGAARPPANKIKKTRGALFNYLVKRYAKENTF